MADADFTLLSTEESRAGAMACMEALQSIEIIAESSMRRPQDDEAGLSMEEWWRIQDAAVSQMFQSDIMGKQRGFIAGFVAVFAEYAMCVNNSGIPDLYKWKPEAIMTKEEKTAYRVEFAKQVAEMDD